MWNSRRNITSKKRSDQGDEFLIDKNPLACHLTLINYLSG